MHNIRKYIVIISAVIIFIASFAFFSTVHAEDPDIFIEQCIRYDAEVDTASAAEKVEVALSEEEQGETTDPSAPASSESDPAESGDATTTDPADGATGASTASEKSFGVGVDIPGHSEPITGYQDYFTAILEFAKNLGLALAILMMIYAGYVYMTSQGNPTAVGEAKDIVVGALSGFALLFVVYLILNLLDIKL